uniref:ZP domain-containing protein n=1 Tax=Steinernema glaseri TaxID=37863 RepID=A0A1I7YDV0_9BILA
MSSEVEIGITMNLNYEIPFECVLSWILHHRDRNLLTDNYCGQEESFRALAYYKPNVCPAQSNIATEVKVTGSKDTFFDKLPELFSASKTASRNSLPTATFLLLSFIVSYFV